MEEEARRRREKEARKNRRAGKERPPRGVEKDTERELVKA